MFPREEPPVAPAGKTVAPADKAHWRRRILDARRHRSRDLCAVDASKLSHVLSELAGGGSTIAAYVPVGTEPRSAAMLDAVRTAGSRVILPVAGEPGPLHWAVYTGPESLVTAAHGLREPSGRPLSPHTLVDADIVLVPALAIDRDGVRLGRGAGFYDRSLRHASPSAMVVGVVYDDEYVDRLPGEPHDVKVTHVLTPRAGLRGVGSE